MAVTGFFTLILLVMLGAFAVSACIFATALLKWIRVHRKMRERYPPPKSRMGGE
jgi:hypothetical protein